MWILKSDGESSGLFYLTPEKKEIIIGRIPISCTLVVENDSSISRKHCSIQIAKQENCPLPVSTKTGIWAVDLGSKYGTFIKLTEGYQKLNPNEPFILPHGCFIRFGIIESVWSVEYKPIMILFNSSINRDLQLNLRTKIGLIGGDAMPFCDDRTSYLVAQSYSLSEKVLLALIHGIPLVTPAFIEELLTAVRNNKPFPDPRNFKPELKEMAVRLEDMVLDPGRNRKSLFSGFQFFVTCPSRQKNLKPIVEAAGGTISIYEDKFRCKLLDEGVIVLETFFKLESSQLSQATNEIKEYLERHGKRTVPVQEIPLAIAYSSTERLCNVNCTEFSIRSATQTPVICSQSTLIEECTEIPKKRIEGHGIIECTSVENTENLGINFENSRQSQLDHVPDSALTGSNIPSSHSVLNKNILNASKICPQISSVSSTQKIAQKRVGSLDIFDDENPKRRFLSQEQGPSSKISVSYNIFQTPAQDSEIISSFDKEIVPSSSQQSISSSISQTHGINEDENPFGKRKIVPETQPTPVKRSRLNYDAVDKPKSSDIFNVGDKNEAVVEHIFATPLTVARVPPVAQASTTRANIHSTPLKDTDSNGWIDMSNKKDGGKTPGEAISTTTIMLSFVNLGQQLHPEPDEHDCPKNVKVFKKQMTPNFDRTIDLQSIPDYRYEFAV